MADEVRFELTVRTKRTPVFKTGTLNHSATHPHLEKFQHIKLIETLHDNLLLAKFEDFHKYK
jgi:hypothetical protein